jgi:hypothetical protein
MTIVSAILRFTLLRSQASTAAFSELRRSVQTKGLVTTQYFGYVLQNEGIPKPKPDSQMCWYIGIASQFSEKFCHSNRSVEWPKESEYRTSQEFKQGLAAIAEDKPRSLIFEFKETKSGEIIKGLEANACEFVRI